MVIYKKKKKNVTDDDPDEYGDFYTLTAMESDTKLLALRCFVWVLQCSKD